MDDRRKILEMLAAGKINAEAAEKLLDALGGEPVAGGPAAGPPSHIHVIVERDQDGGASQVNVRVPIALVRAGVRFARLIPDEARQRANAALRAKGLGFDLDDLNAKTLEDLIAQLHDLQVDVHEKGARVRVYAA